mgnify:CR=1 FL=1
MKKSRFSDFGPRNRAFTSHRSLLDSNRSFLDSSVMDHVLPIDGSLDFPGVALPPICDKASFVTKPGTFTGAIADPAHPDEGNVREDIAHLPHAADSDRPDGRS